MTKLWAWRTIIAGGHGGQLEDTAWPDFLQTLACCFTTPVPTRGEVSLPRTFWDVPPPANSLALGRVTCPPARYRPCQFKEYGAVPEGVERFFPRCTLTLTWKCIPSLALIGLRNPWWLDTILLDMSADRQIAPNLVATMFIPCTYTQIELYGVQQGFVGFDRSPGISDTVGPAWISTR
ncbi:hypothetical protein BO94DRAFT_529832 [Aspergillus sclerotioniger CBS 115572]|uniref:Uncharacterized protein n=1 Tax=Aspergillus sclerotioniger CBS 115572 TaxID=1450535 RepID=A0A317XDN7_9EURO|nr:hypothetical protein BO94DRAFT_529832 [Aspergillus sclerotioniger CBS 115572]PWY96445.1 hypothetical protein BO94DRAFT_529832 [Aspergillus sclerotioniger CBS 115572]